MYIDILRHGECDDQAWLRGRTDSELSLKGQKTMQSQLPDMSKYDRVFCSPAQRCQVFTEQCFEEVKILSDWRERDFGLFDGLSYSQVLQTYPEQLKFYLDSPFDFQIPEAESFECFQKRIQSAWKTLMMNDANSILLVTHGGVMRIILQSLFKLPNEALFHFELGYGARLRIEVFKTTDFDCALFSEPFCKLIEIKQADT